jgi:hypothetical protein
MVIELLKKNDFFNSRMDNHQADMHGLAYNDTFFLFRPLGAADFIAEV